METKEKTVLFSGRFDRPHFSHVDTITRLGERYRKVLVVVLAHEEQTWPVSYRAQKLRELLSRCKGEYEVVVNDVHFGQITKGQLGSFEFDVYGSGNMEVLRHIEGLGIACEYVERSDDTAASDERKYRQIREVIDGRH